LVLRQVYELFAGNCKPVDVLAAGKKEGKRGSFYRHLYYWLYWEAENDRKHPGYKPPDSSVEK
jgi:hypothetical protein